MGVNSLPNTASRLRFEPRPFCACVKHANDSATEPPSSTSRQTGRKTVDLGAKLLLVLMLVRALVVVGQ